MPVAATKHTAAGAQAFAEFFIKTIDWGYATTSSAYMRHYYIASCDGCMDFAKGFDRAKRERHHYIGGRISVTESTIAEHPLARRAVVTVVSEFDIEAIAEANANGHVVNADEAHAGEKLEVSLARRPGGWTVSQLGLDTR